MLLYAAATVIRKAAAFALLPLYAAALSPEHFGALQWVMTMSGLMLIVAQFGLNTVYWKLKSDYGERKSQLVVLSSQFIFAFLLIFVVIALGLSTQSSKIDALSVFFLAQTANLLLDQRLAFLRSVFDKWRYFYIASAYGVINVIAVYIAIIFFDDTAISVCFAYLSVAIIFFIYCCLTCKTAPRKSDLDFGLYKKALTLGVAILTANIAMAMAKAIDKFTIDYMLGAAELGQYAYGAKLGDLIAAFGIQVFMLAWNPVRWRVYKLRLNRDVFLSMHRIICTVGAAGLLVALPALQLLAALMDSKGVYTEGRLVTPIIAFSHYIYLFYLFHLGGLLFLHKNRAIQRITTYGLICNLALTPVAVHVLGANGAAIATCFSLFAMNLGARHYSEHYYPVGFSLILEFAAILIVGLLASYIYFLWPGFGLFMLNIICVLACIAFGVMSWKNRRHIRYVLEVERASGD